MKGNVLTVAQVNAYIKNLFETDYIVKRVWVQGEISNCKIHSSGHVYFTLKDPLSSISCVLFKSYRNNADTLRDGCKVIAHGSISVYEKTGQYQLYVKELIEDGIGLLYERYEALKKQLNEMGYFSEENKKVLPFYPRKIGIVTSETGAAIQDMVKIAKRRNPYIQLVLYPSLVQGDEAKHHIVKGIKALDQIEDIDIIIIGRGGGSIEDLWTFNEEIVAMAIYQAKTPIISAVGHETDFTISDFVADIRAATPSAAVEIAVPSIDSLNDMLAQYKLRLYQSIISKIEQKKYFIELYGAKLKLYHPKRSIEQNILYLNDLQDRLENSIVNQIKEQKNLLNILAEQLKAVSPFNHIEAGYAYISNASGRSIRTIDDLKLHEYLTIQLIDGQVEAEIVGIKRDKGINYGK